MVNRLKFLNDILKPWDEVNELLSQQYAFQPDLSDITRIAGNIAVALRHQVDFSDIKDKQVNLLSVPHSLMCDFGDSYKHGLLRDSSRNSSIEVIAIFEYKNDSFAFLRNKIELIYSKNGCYDFMDVALQAARFWIEKHKLDIKCTREIRYHHPIEFNHIAILQFESKYCIQMDQTKFQFLFRNSDQSFTKCDPPEVRLAII